MTLTIPIAEIFGPTLQGEGELAGRPTYFLRVGGCDFACDWCDSKGAVLPELVRKLPRLTIPEIIKKLALYQVQFPGPRWLTISGGNPALYELGDVATSWQKGLGRVSVETQGSKWKDWLADVDLLTVSPKPPSSSMTNGDDFRFFMARADAFRARATLKVVVFNEEDYVFAQRVHRQYPNVPFYLSCGTASGGLTSSWTPYPHTADHFGFVTDTKEDLLERYRWLAERAAIDLQMADVAVFPQLHALAWGIMTKGV